MRTRGCKGERVTWRFSRFHPSPVHLLGIDDTAKAVGEKHSVRTDEEARRRPHEQLLRGIGAATPHPHARASEVVAPIAHPVWVIPFEAGRPFERVAGHIECAAR